MTLMPISLAGISETSATITCTIAGADSIASRITASASVVNRVIPPKYSVFGCR